jgi:hypothetical protein
MSLPANTTEPSRCVSSPLIVFSTVDLPAPFGIECGNDPRGVRLPIVLRPKVNTGSLQPPDLSRELLPLCTVRWSRQGCASAVRGSNPQLGTRRQVGSEQLMGIASTCALLYVRNELTTSHPGGQLDSECRRHGADRAWPRLATQPLSMLALLWHGGRSTEDQRFSAGIASPSTCRSPRIGDPNARTIPSASPSSSPPVSAKVPAHTGREP